MGGIRRFSSRRQQLGRVFLADKLRAMIKAASGTPTMNSLYRESETSCDDPDDFISDGALVIVEGGERFYTVPPATF